MENIFIHLGKVFFRFRDGLFPVIFIVLVLFTRPALFFGNVQADRYVSILGVALALSGQIFRMLVIGFAYIQRGGKDGKVYAASLVQSGFYAHVRNPMYVGNFLIILGFVILYGSLWGYLLAVPFFTLAYYSIVVNEESYLREKFGREYSGYETRVNRFIPNFRGITTSLADYRYDWRKVLQKEFITISIVLCGLLTITIWKNIALLGYESTNIKIVALSLLFCSVLIFCFTTLYLKKSGQFKTE